MSQATFNRLRSGWECSKQLLTLVLSLFLVACGGSDSNPPVVIDTDLTPPQVTLKDDTGSSASDNITQEGTLLVSGIQEGVRWEYTVDNGTLWVGGDQDRFQLAAGHYDAGLIQVRQRQNLRVSVAQRVGTIEVDQQAAAPRASLDNDTGSSATDQVSQDGTILVERLETGAEWKYSLDEGETWQAGEASQFTLEEGTYLGGKIRVRQTDLAGNTSPAAVMGLVIILQNTPVPPVLSLLVDDGSSRTDGETSNGTILVSKVELGNAWEYSTDNGSTWTPGSGESFLLTNGTYPDGQVQARQTDLAGNLSEPGGLSSVTVDTAETPLLSLVSDNGTFATDNISNQGEVQVVNLEPGATWEYSLDAGVSWTPGTGSTFLLSEGAYEAGVIQARQTDTAGRTSAPGQMPMVVIDQTLPTAPLPSLLEDDGDSASDNVTSNGVIAITGLESDAQWQYSVDNGSTWDNATEPATFTLGVGTYASGVVQLRQIDLAGNLSPVGALGPVTIGLLAPTLALLSDTGTSSNDFISSDGTVVVGQLYSGATWQYTVDNGSNWSAWKSDTANRFTLAPDNYTASTIWVKQKDIIGRESPSTTFTNLLIIDDAAVTPTLSVDNDTDDNATDNRISSRANVLRVSGLELGASWQYSLDGGGFWTTGSATKTFSVSPVGTYASGDIQVKQTDLAGNTSEVGTLALEVYEYPSVPGLALSPDGGSSSTDNLTWDNGSVLILVTYASGNSWQYTLDNGSNWDNGSGNSFSLMDNYTYDSSAGRKVWEKGQIKVRQVDGDGNVSDNASMGRVELDNVSPTVWSTLPFDNDTLIWGEPLSVTFSEVMNPNSLTTSDNASCLGTVQLSADNFSSCVLLSSTLTSSDNLTFQFTASDLLTPGSRYFVRIDGAEDASGNPVDNSTAWTQDEGMPVLGLESLAYLKSNTPTGSDRFGAAVAVDSQNLYVSAPYDDEGGSDAGAVFVFDNSSGLSLGSTKRVSHAGALYGYALSADSESLFVGEPMGGTTFSGAIYADNTSRTLSLNNYGAAGFSVASSNGKAIVGVPMDGGSSIQYITDVSVGEAPGSASFSNDNGSSWSALTVPASLTSTASFGWSVARSSTLMAVGAPGDNESRGAVVVYGDDGTFREQLLPANVGSGDQFGYAVALSGDFLAVGAPGEASEQAVVSRTEPSDNTVIQAGAVYVYKDNGTTFELYAFIKPGNPGESDKFGSALALDNGTLVIGAPYEDSYSTDLGYLGATSTDNDTGDDYGAAYVFRDNGSDFVPVAYLKADNAGAGDQFGTAVAISGDLILVGAPYEDSGQSALSSAGASDDNTTSAGAAYLFKMVE